MFNVNRLLKYVLSGFAVSMLTACLLQGGDGANKNDGSALSKNGDTDHSELLANISDKVVIPAYQAFVDQTSSWQNPESSIDAYCQSIDSTDEVNKLDAAQQSWRNAMAGWQQLEAFQIGPITDNAFNLRNRIYSWPEFVSNCTVDKNVAVLLDDSANFDISTLSRQAQGLDALEYLLFNTDLNHSCPKQIVEIQNWNVKSDSERKLARCEYAKHVAKDVNNNANSLLNAWLESGGNYRQVFIQSGSDGGAFDTQSDALNALSDSLFYLSNDVKDRKLGLPIGLSTDCETLTCASERESSFSENSLANIKNNLIGFRAVFTGSFKAEDEVPSFDDELARKNFPEISTEILAYTDSAISLINRASSSLSIEINRNDNEISKSECVNAASNPDSESEYLSCRLYGKLKRITDELKGDFLTVISLTLPQRVEGDND